MSERFKTVDLSQLILPGDACARFSRADVPVDPGVPFVIVHLKTNAATDNTLRLDLDKRVFLGHVGDDRVQSYASQIAQYISGVAFGAIPASPLRS